MKYLCSFVIAFLFASTLLAQSFQGSFKLVNNTYTATLKLQTTDDVNYNGTLSGSIGQMQVTGLVKQGILTGNIQSQQGNSYFTFLLQAGKYAMTTMNYNFYGQPMPATAVNFYFEKQQANHHAAISSGGKSIFFNGVKIDDATIAQLENYYKVKAQSGCYWYDKVSGLWGIEGDKTYGVMLPNLPLGGPLKANASNGDTGVFINGRNLPQADLTIIQTVTGYLKPGKYWIDYEGNAGLEGGPALVNLKQVTNKQNGGGSTFYRNSYTSTGSGSSGGTFYVIGKDFSYIGGN